MIDVTAWQPLAAALIKSFEGCKLRAYPDPATGGAPWTIGWGATGPGIHMGTVWTQAQADDAFLVHLGEFGDGVVKLLHDVPTNAHQMASLVSFAFNCGLANLSGSTLLRLHRAGDYAGARAEFGKWNRAAGKVMAGLTRRRAAEAAMYGASA